MKICKNSILNNSKNKKNKNSSNLNSLEKNNKQINNNSKKKLMDKKNKSSIKEIKLKQKIEKSKRIETLKEKGKIYYSIKIQNPSVPEPIFLRSHNDEEIEMAKKILLNKWEFPPIDYLEHVYQQSHPQLEKSNETSPNKDNKNNDNEHEKKIKKFIRK